MTSKKQQEKQAKADAQQASEASLPPDDTFDVSMTFNPISVHSSEGTGWANVIVLGRTEHGELVIVETHRQHEGPPMCRVVVGKNSVFFETDVELAVMTGMAWVRGRAVRYNIIK